jgi:hypothetical protein
MDVTAEETVTDVCRVPERSTRQSVCKVQSPVVAVGLSEHAVDVVGEVVELEPEVEVREAVVVGDAVAVDP